MLQPTRRDLAVALAAAALTLTGAELLRSQDPVQRWTTPRTAPN